MPTPDTHLLITGSGGLLGERVRSVHHTPIEKFGGRLSLHYHRAPKSGLPDNGYAGDLGDEDQIAELAEKIQPDIIINCAASADVDRCEREPGLSERVNLKAVEYLLRAFPEARFIQISTDYVFPDSPTPPLPDTATGPLNVYGQHKLAAEKAVLLQADTNLVIRTNTMYDYGKKRNFFSFVYESLKSGKSIRALTDQYSNPISAESAAVLIRQLIDKDARGIFHIGGSEKVSRYELADHIARWFSLPERLITPVVSGEIPRPAARPAHAGLDCRKTELFLQVSMPRLEYDLTRLRREMES